MVETMALPGAARCTVALPKLEKSEARSSGSVAITHSTLGLCRRRRKQKGEGGYVAVREVEGVEGMGGGVWSSRWSVAITHSTSGLCVCKRVTR